MRSPCKSVTVAWMLALVPILVFSAGNVAARSQKDKKSDDRTTNLKIQVAGGAKAEPVAQASVYIRFQEAATLHLLTRKHRKVELDLKTDQQGIASVPDLPQGKVLIQVVAEGWATYGEYYDLNQDNQTISIKLQRPETKWY
jgi:hypothetical protein